MKRLEASDLLDLTRYELERDAHYRAIIQTKRPRRIGVGGELTFVFENRATVWFQIQEMIRTERIVKPDAIQAELDVYNELLPGDDELSATLMIEITDAAQIRPTLDRLVGIDEYVSLRIGDARVPAKFDPKQFEEDRISAVQYVRFPLGPALARAFRDTPVPVMLAVDHPSYVATTEITGESRRSLAEDLAPDTSH